MALNPQAVELNASIQAANPHVLDLLTDKGRAIFFPKRGILAQSAAAAGKAINATIGTALEDDGKPMALEPLVKQLVSRDRTQFNYAPAFGRPDLRAKWKEMMLKKNPGLGGAAISLPVATCALTHGLSMGAYLFTGPGDTVLMPDLYWENYDLLFTNGYGAAVRTYPTFAGGGFNVAGLKQALAEGPKGKRVVLLNFPNNPTGYTATEAEGRQITQALIEAADAGNDVVVFLDDAYFGLVFEPGVMQESLFAQLAQAHERILAVKFDGPTKEDYVWGFRVGFVTFGCKRNTPALYAALEGKLGGAIRGNISNVNNLGQSMLLAAYTDPAYDTERAAKREILKRRYEKIRDTLKARPDYAGAYVALPFNSGYFMCVRVLAGDAEAVQQILLKDFDTGIIAFGDIIRIAFSATPLGKIEKLLENIYQAAKKAAGK
jgi:aspartate/methionine/tyrosine aminotransferase